MKALTERLEWIRLYMIGTLGDRDDEKNKQLAIDEWIACNAIAEALPEITIVMPASVKPERTPPDRVIERPTE